MVALALALLVNEQIAAAVANEHRAALVAVIDVGSGQLVASAGDVNEQVLPLSVIKVALAASLLEHGIDDGLLEIIARGADAPAMNLAVRLRAAIGAAVVLADVRRFGFDISLAPAASDQEWGDTFSIGEQSIKVTPLEVARFFRLIGNDSLRTLTPPTQQQLRRALLETVERGSARSIRDRVFAGKIGGKTGTGPHRVAPDSDGWFAGLIFDVAGQPRFAFATYVRKGGLGGGAAARISADIANILLSK
jgi:cell division protein FtsI/penicillin-binding protein 2